jgi:hypothetical protein
MKLQHALYNYVYSQTGKSDKGAGSRAQVPSLGGDLASADELEVEVCSEEGDVNVAVERSKNCTTVVGIDELKRLQREDTTLSRIREKAEARKGHCYWQDGLLYCQWSPAGQEEVNDIVVDQLVLPLQCRSGVLQLAHNNPISDHLGRRKILGRIQQRIFWPGILRHIA